MTTLMTSNIDAEELAIVSLCDSPETIRLYLMSFLHEDHFGYWVITNMFKRIKSLLDYNKEVPSSKLLKLDPALPDESKEYIGNLKIAPLTNKNDVDQLITVLETKRKIRLIIKLSENSIEKIKAQNPDIDLIATDIENNLLKLRSANKEDMLIHSGVEDNYDPYIKEIMNDVPPDLIPTGFKSFDTQAGGLDRTGLLIISTVPGGGKSVMMGQLGINFTRAGYSSCIVSLEMNKRQMTNRIISNVTQIPYDTIRRRTLSAKQKETLCHKYYNVFKKQLIKNRCRLTIFCPEEAYTLNDYKHILKPLNYDIIGFDYISLITDKRHSGNVSHWEMLMNHSRDGKLMAQQMQTAIIMAAQLDENTGNIRYSKAIKENCNNWWKWDYGENERETNIVEIEQGKARDHKMFPFSLIDNFECMGFEDTGDTNQNAIKKETPKSMINLSDEDF